MSGASGNPACAGLKGSPFPALYPEMCEGARQALAPRTGYRGSSQGKAAYRTDLLSGCRNPAGDVPASPFQQYCQHPFIKQHLPSCRPARASPGQGRTQKEANPILPGVPGAGPHCAAGWKAACLGGWDCPVSLPPYPALEGDTLTPEQSGLSDGCSSQAAHPGH